MYAKTKGMGGIMFWTIDTDDFRSSCYDAPYPLLTTGRRLFFGEKLQLDVFPKELRKVSSQN